MTPRTGDRLHDAPTACVIGWPVKHSRSPVIHRFWLRQYGIDGDYVIHPVEPDAIERILSRASSTGPSSAATSRCRTRRRPSRRSTRSSRRPGDRRGQHHLARRAAAGRDLDRRRRLPRQSRRRRAGLGRRAGSGGDPRRRRRGARGDLGAPRARLRAGPCRQPDARAAPRRSPRDSVRTYGRRDGMRCPGCFGRRASSSTRRRSAWTGSRRSTSTLRRLRERLPRHRPRLCAAGDRAPRRRAGAGAPHRRRPRHAPPPGGAGLRRTGSGGCPR